ncbi:MAG: tRNA pseudouridine(55) synthase TruB [Oscillospiraceae bacterium]
MNINGVLVIDKPEDFTSFDVIAKTRGILSTRKIGHSGTLDPMATGVLVLFLGNATKAIPLMKTYNKRYIGEVQIGVLTDTLDITGNVLKTIKTNFSKEDLLNVLDKFKGDIDQKPPMYSAIKINGQKLYNLARKGKEVERNNRKIKIEEINVLKFCDKTQTFILDVTCSKGTYIRSLASDICEMMGSIGCLKSLRRFESDGFSLDKSITINEIIDLNNAGKLKDRVVKVETLFLDLPIINLDIDETEKFNNGVKLDIHSMAIGDRVRIYDYKKKFIAIAYIDDCEKLRLKSFFKE